MWYVIVGVIGLVLGAAGVYFFVRQVVVVVDADLEEAVGQLHKALFMGAGIPIEPFFNVVWREAGLPESGVPDIIDGRT